MEREIHIVECIGVQNHTYWKHNPNLHAQFKKRNNRRDLPAQPKKKLIRGNLSGHKVERRIHYKPYRNHCIDNQNAQNTISFEL